MRGFSQSVWMPMIEASRPNSVSYQGVPAAGNPPSTSSSCHSIRRSLSDRSRIVFKKSLSVLTWVESFTHSW